MIRGFTQESEKGKIIYEAEMTVSGHSKDVSFDAAGNVVGIRWTAFPPLQEQRSRRRRLEAKFRKLKRSRKAAPSAMRPPIRREANYGSSG
jgi:hypothetical protein